MGGSISHTVQFLKDPMLVRKFQELCGVIQVMQDEATATVGSDAELEETKLPSKQDNMPSKPGTHSRKSSGEFNGNLDWLRKAKKRRKIRSSPSPSPGHSRTSSLESEIDPSSLQPSQSEVIIESYPLLDVFFRIATECGYEPFYITAIPFIFWNVDTLIARRITLLWAISMYVGQACKQLFKWKRPASPPAFRLEDNPNLETEYGFPSTHAIVSTVMPFYIFYGSYGRYEYPFLAGLVVAVLWCSSVCASRLYLGVHSFLDILGGIFISTTLLMLFVPNINQIDEFLLNSQYTCYLFISAVLVLMYIYPVHPDKWTMDRGDTAAILGGSCGVVLGSWYHGGYPDDKIVEVMFLEFPSVQNLSLSIVRFVTGVLILLPTRFIMKLLCFKMLPLLMPTHGVSEVVHRPLVELPYKLITYGAMGFNASYTVLVALAAFGISRW